MDSAKPVESLSIDDLAIVPVWRFANSDGDGETLVVPVKNLPVKNLAGKLVGTRVLLANGSRNWVLVGNVDTTNARLTEHFMTLSFEREGRWFHLARYHDYDFQERGPAALACFLGLPVEAVFPISYDLSDYSEGVSEALVGTVAAEPRERLSRAEIIGLAVP